MARMLSIHQKIIRITHHCRTTNYLKTTIEKINPTEIIKAISVSNLMKTLHKKWEPPSQIFQLTKPQHRTVNRISFQPLLYQWVHQARVDFSMAHSLKEKMKTLLSDNFKSIRIRSMIVKRGENQLDKCRKWGIQKFKVIIEMVVIRKRTNRGILILALSVNIGKAR